MTLGFGGWTMTEKPSGLPALRHAAFESPAVALSLSRLADRSKQQLGPSPGVVRGPAASSPVVAYMPVPPMAAPPMAAPSREARARLAGPVIGILLLTGGILAVAVVLGPALLRLVHAYWKTILLALGVFCIGAGVILAARQVGRAPLRNIQPPDDTTNEPLEELERFVKRSGSRLRTAYQVQMALISLVALAIFAVIAWSILMVTKDQLMYATLFGTTGVAMLALSRWKWQPFERVAEARRLADNADVLATGLRMRIESISKIPDPKERAEAQWQAVNDYLKLS